MLSHPRAKSKNKIGTLQPSHSSKAQLRTVMVRTADDAKSVAGIALQRDINIPPTVKVAQGTTIRIFTARDLDFSGTDGGMQ